MALVETLAGRLLLNLQTISGLRVFDYWPDKIPVSADPAAVAIVTLAPSRSAGQYDAVFNGVSWWDFEVTVIVSRVTDRTGQKRLYRYISTTGANSIKVAIESDKTLNGNAQLLLVEQPQNAGEITVADVDYWGAQWLCRVLA